MSRRKRCVKRLANIAGRVKRVITRSVPITCTSTTIESANRLSSLDNVIDMEQEALRSAVAQITAVRPDILLVERSVARYEHVCPNFRQGVNMSTLQGRG